VADERTNGGTAAHEESHADHGRPPFPDAMRLRINAGGQKPVNADCRRLIPANTLSQPQAGAMACGSTIPVGMTVAVSARMMDSGFMRVKYFVAYIAISAYASPFFHLLRKSICGGGPPPYDTTCFESTRPEEVQLEPPPAFSVRQFHCSMPAKSSKPQSKSVTASALPDAALEMIAGRFRALSEPARLRLLNTLMSGERNVSQLVEATGTGQANVSRHLAVLRQAGMIAMRREGLTTVCSISDPSVHQLCEIMCSRLRADAEARAKALS
jgi:DNA-binding transcriptional ArsR family regulator